MLQDKRRIKKDSVTLSNVCLGIKNDVRYGDFENALFFAKQLVLALEEKVKLRRRKDGE